MVPLCIRKPINSSLNFEGVNTSHKTKPSVEFSPKPNFDTIH